jgi:hypothetical protein
VFLAVATEMADGAGFAEAQRRIRLRLDTSLRL